MARYKAQSADSLNFSLTAEDKPVGRLKYQKWFSFKAEMELIDGSVFQAEPNGFWGTTIEIKDNGTLLLDFKMNWIGHIVINTAFDETEGHLMFKHKGIMSSNYVLLDEEEYELLVVEPDFKWSKFNYDYDITTTEKFDRLAHKDLLLLTTVHCANYFMTMMTTAMMAAS